ncbi:MAG: hypothetical protein KAH22_11930 [Thiotrichaceae bacterium]|nr:hypothetical protein [Thiotrichaceae bacterium]
MKEILKKLFIAPFAKQTSTTEFWAVIANIKNKIPYGSAGKEKKSGLKKFKAGAKVHIIGAFYGMGERLVVIGQHRNSGKYISCVISVTAVENFRVKKIYSKKILQLIENSNNHNTGETAFTTKEKAEELAKVIPVWIEHNT